METEILNLTIALTLVLLMTLGLAKKAPLFTRPDDDRGQPISWLKIPVGNYISCHLEQLSFALIGDWRSHGYHLPDRADDVELSCKISVAEQVEPSHEGGPRGLDFMALQGALVVDLLRLCFTEKWTLGGDDDCDTYAVPDGTEIVIRHVQSAGSRTRYTASLVSGGRLTPEKRAEIEESLGIGGGA